MVTKAAVAEGVEITLEWQARNDDGTRSPKSKKVTLPLVPERGDIVSAGGMAGSVTARRVTDKGIVVELAGVR